MLTISCFENQAEAGKQKKNVKQGMLEGILPGKEKRMSEEVGENQKKLTRVSF